MPGRTDIKKILILGGGPVVIGQGCELDQLACQAIAALRAEGYQTVYVNSNPSAVSSDPDIADATYLEPLSIDAVISIIDKEQPDALLPNYGGQTALNLTMQLSREYGLKGLTLLGVDPEVITKVEDRREFKATMEQAGLPVLPSEVAETIEQGLKAVGKTGFPTIIRSAYTTGGGGSAVAYNVEEFVAMVSAALKSSPVEQVLIEKTVLGWKETELEVLRDAKGSARVVAVSESVDPAGVHTGDSPVVIPALTLSAEQVAQLEQMAIKAVQAMGAVGAAGVRFAINPETGEIAIMGASVCVGPLTSISGLLAGASLGAVCAKLAVGYCLDEAFSKEDGGAAVTVKLPRFAFDRFPDADQTLGTSMKSIGEAIGVGGCFAEALQKAIRALEISRAGLGADGRDAVLEPESIRALVAKPNPRRLFFVKQALQAGVCPNEIAELSKLDPWFIDGINQLVEFEKGLEGKSLVDLTADGLARAKALGYSDAQLAYLFETTEDQVRIRRKVLAITPKSARLGQNVCYSTFGEARESVASASSKKVLVLGGGPNRIGQGGEFDYCRFHALRVLGEAGFQGVAVNANPTAVIPDSAELFVDPQTTENILSIIEREQPESAIIQFAGQTLLGLGQAIAKAGVPVLGTTIESSTRAKDPKKLAELAKKLGIKKVPSESTTSAGEAQEKAEKVGYPVLARAARAYGGHASEILYDASDLEAFLSRIEVSFELPLLFQKFMEGAIEVGVDAIADGEQALICGVMEFIEQAGVHPGDSAGALPPYSLAEETVEEIKRGVRGLAMELGIKGLLGAQFAVRNGETFLLDVQPRASRTVPFVSKATGIDWVGAATRIMLGQSLAQQGITSEPAPAGVSVKETVFPFARFPNVDVVLGPEMRSTGEAIGMNASFGAAYIKAQLAAGQNLPEGGTAFLSVSGRDKSDAVEIGKRLHELGFDVVATAGTGDALRAAGVDVRVISKIGEGRPDAIDLIKNGEMDLIINTPSGKRPRQHEVTIRSATVARGIPIVTTMAGAKATMFGMEAIRKHKSSVRKLQE